MIWAGAQDGEVSKCGMMQHCEVIKANHPTLRVAPCRTVGLSNCQLEDIVEARSALPEGTLVRSIIVVGGGHPDA